jgi:co-chaperonin GroES (HSP10)
MQDEQLHDLKTLTQEQFEAKYIVENYSNLVYAMTGGKELPQLIRVESTVSHKLEPGEKMPKFKATVKIPEKVQYAADALGDNVLVVRVEREHSSQLIIPESAKTKSDVGRVMAIGPDVKRCIKGDLVLFDKFASHGKEIDLVDDQGIPRQHLLLNDVDVQLKLTRFTSLPS